MNILTRRLMYLSIMPLLFFFNIMVTLTWFNTTIPLALLVVGVLLLRVSDRGKYLVNLNDWVKRKFLFAFPDLYETGVMPTERTLLVCIPAIVSMLLNIPLSKL